nr:SGNH/GDSL hydrolase family protein [uncultured Lichenicoccus sp.]
MPETTTARTPAQDTDSAAFGFGLSAAHLPRSRAALADGRTLRITVFGSSTTEGIGASAPIHSFPQVMRASLVASGVAPVSLSNRGVGGNNARDLHARLGDVITDAPDLVLFQTGSNDPLQDVPVAEFGRLTRADLRTLRAHSQADIVLVDQQLCRMLEECEAFPPYLTALHEAGADCGVPVFPRYQMMQSWSMTPGMDRDRLSPDGLHMGDAGYRLLGEALAGWLRDALLHRDT